MTKAKLSDLQLIALSAASRRKDCSIYPLPRGVKKTEATDFITTLMRLKLIEEIEGIGNVTVWRQDKQGCNLTLILANNNFKILGVSRDENNDTETVTAKIITPSITNSQSPSPNPAFSFRLL